ncbi:hypothetical protein AAHB37_00545 [Glutamicibacter halophytocola]|uniref:hypothetical protein n=1 Tax=Glutamicibacter halophytocola TaxID=1933880 RepID=UPI00321B9534
MALHNQGSMEALIDDMWRSMGRGAPRARVVQLANAQARFQTAHAFADGGCGSPPVLVTPMLPATGAVESAASLASAGLSMNAGRYF